MERNSMEFCMKQQTHRELADDELNRIERLIEATTAGPWYSYVAGRDADVESNRVELGWCNELGSFKSMEIDGATVADQDFIASARQDLPRLLLEVRSLRARLASLRSPDTGRRRQPLNGAVKPPVNNLAADRR